MSQTSAKKGWKSSNRQSLALKNSLPKASALFLVMALLFVLLNVVLLMSESVMDKRAPQAVKGELNLSGVSLDSGHSYPLTGNWAVYWQQLLSPQDLFLDAKGANSPRVNYMQLPHAWNREAIDGKPLENHGVMTYHLKVQTDKHYQQLGLKIPSIGTSFNLFVNEQLMASGGKVGVQASQSEPGYNPQILLFEPGGKTFDLVIQVANFDYFWGGPWHPLRISTPPLMYQEQFQHTVRSAFLIGIFITVALFNLIQFTLRPKDPLPVSIALTCIMLGLRELETTQVLHIAGITDWSFATNARISFLTFYLATPVVIAYFHLSFYRDYDKRVMSVIYTLTLAFGLFVIFFPPPVFSPSMPWFQILSFLIMPYVLWGLMQAVRNKRYGARMLLLGSLFLFALIINDILYNRGVIDSVLLVSFGLVAFILCQNYITYLRFILASRENELLSQTLEVRNIELKEFSQSLEDKVKDRTYELAKANERLEELAHQDSLTGLPNRRGMKGAIEASVSQFNRKQTPFCLLLIDFDRFKELNDSLGHEAGDKVLIDGAALMRNSLREQDLVARWGGEEFLLLLPCTSIAGAAVLAEKLKHLVREELTQAMEFPISITIGVSEYRQDDTLDTCLNRADKALYQGKEGGRDKVVLAQ